MYESFLGKKYENKLKGCDQGERMKVARLLHKKKLTLNEYVMAQFWYNNFNQKKKGPKSKTVETRLFSKFITYFHFFCIDVLIQKLFVQNIACDSISSAIFIIT